MNKAEVYAQTLFYISENKSAEEFDSFFTKFIAYIESKQEQKLLPKILQLVEQLGEKNTSQNTILTVAKKEDAEKFTKELQSMGESFDATNIKIQEDSNIVGGFIARSNTAMVDASYRRGLLEMYQKLVA